MQDDVNNTSYKNLFFGAITMQKRKASLGRHLFNFVGWSPLSSRLNGQPQDFNRILNHKKREMALLKIKSAIFIVCIQKNNYIPQFKKGSKQTKHIVIEEIEETPISDIFTSPPSGGFAMLTIAIRV